MALHGEIKVNGQIVAFWEAVRKEAALKTVNEYACKVMVVSPLADNPYEDDGFPGVIEFDICHVYADGAVTLASKVMTEASERMIARNQFARSRREMISA